MKWITHGPLLYLAAKIESRLLRVDVSLEQQRLLSKLLQKNRHTLFGKQHHFSSIPDEATYLERVQPRRYAEFQVYIDRILRGEPDVLFTGVPLCFARTSGTVQEAKLLPINRGLFGCIDQTAFEISLLAGLKIKSMAWLWKKTLYVDPRREDTLRDWDVYAKGTAYVYRQAPLFRRRFVPSLQELPEKDADYSAERLKSLLQKYDVATIAGNPIDIVRLASEPDLCAPQVALIFHCGYYLADHQHVLERAFPNAHIVDFYGTNEGTLGLPFSTSLFLMNAKRIHYSFLELHSGGSALPLSLVELNRKYELCVTTPGGLYNYATGDVVAIESLRPPLIRLCGRVDRMLSVKGENLTEDEVVRAVRLSGIRSRHYCLAPNNGGYVLYTDDVASDAGELDRTLCLCNSSYAKARETGHLCPVSIQFHSNWDNSWTKLRRIVADEKHISPHANGSLPSMSPCRQLRLC